ncbi:OmpA family protein, partial [Thalassovita aquimarina]|uniref:OmpA family protein n=1 Tax=Thalassovita aquimarina TaxID=2785917 RepID=UPI0035662427
DYTDVTDDGDDSDGNTTDDETETLATIAPVIKVTKTVDDSALEDGVRAGDTLNYTIKVENIGNITLSDVALTDNFKDLHGGTLSLTAGPTKASDTGAIATDTTMDVGDVWIYEASYDLTDGAIATGGVENIAVVTAKAPDDSVVTAESKVGGNTSVDGDGTPTDTGFPGEVSGTVRQYERGISGIVVYLLKETAPGSGVFDYVMVPDNPSQRLSTVTDESGEYVFIGLAPGTYGVEFDNPGSQADPTAISADYSETANRITGIVVDAGDVEVEQDAFFVDPSGVIYDSSSFTPIPGAVVTLYYQATSGASRSVVPNAWLNDALGDLNAVSTGTDGAYSFFLDPATAQNGIYSIEVSKSGYEFASQTIAPQPGTFDPGLGGGVVQITNAAVPADGMDTSYYLSYQMAFSADPATTSNGVVNNHIPLDPGLVLPLVEDDLLLILKDDLAVTMTQQSRQMNSYAAGALQRLKSRDRDQCLVALAKALDDQPVLFDTDKSTLKPESGAILDKMADILNSCEAASFEIAGHTDDRASDAYNMVLSQARVDAVVAALGQRGVNTERLAAKGYGETRPIADNATAEGRAANRRVEFLPLDKRHKAEECVATDTIDRGINASANNSGAAVDGSYHRETRNCQNDSWRIVSGTASYLKNDNGVSQGMFNLTVRTEKFVTDDRVFGRFLGVYGSKSDITGLATGDIKGFGLNAGIYGANRFASGLFLDYYLSGAIGRHAFDLDFDRTGGVVHTEGNYRYFAAFGGAALSGQTQMGRLIVSPRAGLDLAWSPGGDVDVTATRGAIEDSGNLRIGRMSGARLFGEARIEDLLPGRAEVLAITPRIFCDKPIGGGENSCGYGAAIELSRENLGNGTSFSATLDGERSENHDSIGLVFEYAKSLSGGQLTGTTSVSSQGEIAITTQYKLEF